MFTSEEAAAYSKNISLVVKMIPYKTSIQNETVAQNGNDIYIGSKAGIPEGFKLLDIKHSIKNHYVINKLAKIAARHYKETPNNEALFCLSMTLATIIKEYEWGTEYLTPNGLCTLAKIIICH